MGLQNSREGRGPTHGWLANQNWKSREAIGAAVDPPVADSPDSGLPSMKTARAIDGLSTGAKPINQGLENSPVPVAVPVLPATRTPGTAARLPVPSVITLSIIWARVEAVSGCRYRP